MEPLNPTARAFLERAKQGEAPREEDRVRAQQALARTLATGAPSKIDAPAREPQASPQMPGGQAGAALANAVPMSRVRVALVTVFAVGVATGHVLTRAHASSDMRAQLVSRTLEAAPKMVTVRAEPTTQVTSPIVPSAALSPQAIATGSARDAVPSASAAAPTGESEARAILVAKRKLESGQAREALRALEEHERIHPHGTLSEERDALRVVALCSLGLPEGQEERSRFLRNHPVSPYVERVRAACPGRSSP